jgi:gliding motility-associated-like protein
MLNKTIIVFIYVFVLNIFLLKAQPQTISLCGAISVNKKYWVESVLGYNNVWSIDPYVDYQLQQDNTIVVQWTDPGVYTIVAQYFNENCSSKGEIQVQVEECPDVNIYIPSAFSPNDDNINDVFLVKGIGIIDYNLAIFNRWGEEIFMSTNIFNGWDGTYNQLPCQEDIYVYVIRYQGKIGPKRQIYGKISLIK